MFDCTDEVRDYVEAQEIARSISLDVEGIVDAALAKAPKSIEEALMFVDEMIDEACVNGTARDDSAFADDAFSLDDGELLDWSS